MVKSLQTTQHKTIQNQPKKIIHTSWFQTNSAVYLRIMIFIIINNHDDWLIVSQAKFLKYIQETARASQAEVASEEVSN